MLTFDKLKIVSSIENIDVIIEDRFEKVIKDGKIAFLKYHHDKDFLLDIKIDYIENEVVVEFTGKILGRKYPRLISIETIDECFANINSLGFCHLDVEGMMNSEVVKCDITKDILVADIPQLINHIKNHNKNYQKILCRKMKNGNLVIEKNVTSKRCQKRLTIYDKEKEMNKACNKQFIEDNGLNGAFDGRCRFELNLNSKEQIRSSLGVKDTRLRTVLMAETKPILRFLDEVVCVDNDTIDSNDRKAYFALLVLKDCDYDLEKVEAKMRGFYQSRGTSIKTVMEPYRQMMKQIEDDGGDNKMWESIKGQLS